MTPDKKWELFDRDRAGAPDLDSRYDLTFGHQGASASWYICRVRGTDDWWVSPGNVSTVFYEYDRGPYTREVAEALVETLDTFGFEDNRQEPK